MKFNLSNFDKDRICIDVPSFKLNRLFISSDVSLDIDEIVYLTNFKVGSQIDSEKIKQALFYLYLKNCFKNVSIDIKNDDLKLVLESCWRVNRISVFGLLFGKYDALQQYVIGIGDRFDTHKHLLSLANIRKYLLSEGYFASKVSSRIKKNCFNKTVDVDINIKKRKKFIIKEVSIESDFKRDLIERVFNRNLLGLKFNLQKIGLLLKKIKIQLLNVGIYASNLKLNFLKNDNRRAIKILVDGDFKSLREISFQGNKYFSSEQLLSHIYSREWFLSGFYPILIVEHLKKLYKKNGFLDVSIDFQECEEILKLDIVENKRTLIKNIRINSEFFSSEYLRKKFFKTLQNKYYNVSIVSRCLEDLIDFYTSNGFWDAIIVDQDISADGVLKIVLNEGARRFLSDVKIKDFNQYNKKIPYGNLDKCIPFDSKIIDYQKKWLTVFFKNIGYKNFEFIPELKSNKDAIELEWSLLEKHSDFAFGRSVIRGNVKVPFKQLEKEIVYREFGSLNKEDVDATFNRLKGIDGFESIHITPSKFLISNNTNPMIINLINMSKFELHARLGFQQVNNSHILNWRSRSTYKLGGSFLLRNPLNVGDSLKVDADFTIFYRHLVAQYNLPWLFSAPIRTVLRFYANKYFQPLYLGSNDVVYRISQLGGLSALDYKYKFSGLGTSFGAENLKVTQMSDRVAKAIDFSTSLIDKRLPFIFIEPTFLIEHVDSKINPTKGISFFMALKGAYSPFLQDVSYFRVLLENSIFYPVIRNVVFAVRNRFGHIFINSLENLLPSERFYLGGSNSIRSYEPDFAPPLGVFQEGGKEQLFPTGSKTMFNSNIELRFKLFKSFGVALFQDIGFLTRGNLDVRQDKIVTATGFGLRYFTPIGPLRFDIGWRPKRFDNDSNFSWYLTLGQSF
jgi:outer membrane protein assembly factor BamA